MKKRVIVKRTAAVFLAAVMVLAFSGCGLLDKLGIKSAMQTPVGSYHVFALDIQGNLVEAEGMDISSEMVLEKDQTGQIDFNGAVYEVQWTNSEADLEIAYEDEVVYGTYENGIATLEFDPDMIYYYAKEKADTSSFNVMTAEEFIASGAAEQLLLQDGIDYYYGINGAEYDWDAAMEEFQEAADSGSANAWYYIGKLYENSREDQRFTKMKEAFETAEELGSALGSYALGRMYLIGKGVDCDYELAGEYFETAMDAGLVEAGNGLGNLFRNGYGVEKDPSAAIDYYMMAMEGSEFGIVNAAKINLGELYLNGADGVEKDEALGLEYIDDALDADYSSAYTAYGTLYRDGKGMEQDLNKAIDYYTVGAEKGDSDGYFYIGNIYLFGELGEPDYEMAKKYYELAIEMGHIGALVNYGWIAEQDPNQEPDYDTAFACNMEAAEGGDEVAFYNIATFYADGTVVAKDEAEAFKWYMKAAQLDYPDAQLMVGIMYHNGEGVEKDDAEAVKWLTLALENAGSDQELIDEIQKVLDEINAA